MSEAAACVQSAANIFEWSREMVTTRSAHIYQSQRELVKEDEYDEYLNETECGRFFVQKGARGRIRFDTCEQREAALLTLIHTIFPRKVSEAYGGVFWGIDQSFVAMTMHEQMFFNARAERTPYDLFLDICHEYAHVALQHHENVHDEEFACYLETIASTYLPAFMRFMANICS